MCPLGVPALSRHMLPPMNLCEYALGVARSRSSLQKKNLGVNAKWHQTHAEFESGQRQLLFARETQFRSLRFDRIQGAFQLPINFRVEDYLGGQFIEQSDIVLARGLVVFYWLSHQNLLGIGCPQDSTPQP